MKYFVPIERSVLMKNTFFTESSISNENMHRIDVLLHRVKSEHRGR